MGPRHTRIFLTLALITLAGGLVLYKVWYSFNQPYQDEWWFTPIVVGDAPVSDYLWQKHNEHYYPLGKFVYVKIVQYTYSFPVPAWLTVFLLTASAWYLMRAIGRCRGRAAVADAVIPALLLHWGHYENILIAYQIVLTIPMTALAFVLAEVIRADRLTGWAIPAMALPLLILIQGGGFGLAYGLAVSVWILVVAILSRPRSFPGLLAILVAAMGIGVILWLLFGGGRAPASDRANIAKVVRVGLEYYGVAFGPAAAVRGRPIPVAGIIHVALTLGCLLLLLRATIRQPSERIRATGLAAVLMGNMAVAVGIAVSRDAGLAPRYAIASCWGLIACYFTLVIYGPRLTAGRSGLVTAIQMVLSLGMVLDQLTWARTVGNQRFQAAWRYHHDVMAGRPLAELESTYAPTLFFPDSPLALCTEPLLRHRFGRFATWTVHPSP